MNKHKKFNKRPAKIKPQSFGWCGNIVRWRGEVTAITSKTTDTTEESIARIKSKLPKQIGEELEFLKMQFPLLSGEIGKLRWYFSGMTSTLWFTITPRDEEVIQKCSTGTEMLVHLMRIYPEFAEKASVHAKKTARRPRKCVGKPSKRIEVVSGAKKFLANGGKHTQRAVAVACKCSLGVVNKYWSEILG